MFRESLCGPMGGVGESARRLFRHTELHGTCLDTSSTIGWPSLTVLLWGLVLSQVLPPGYCLRFSSRRSVFVL